MINYTFDGFTEIRWIGDTIYLRVCDNGWQTNSIPVRDMKTLIELRDKINEFIERNKDKP